MKLHYLRKDIKLKHLLIFDLLQYLDYLLLFPFIIIAYIYYIIVGIYKILIDLSQILLIYGDIKDIRYARGLLSGTYANKVGKEYKKINH